MMHLSQTSTKGFNDVVFDHRNQAYGAFVLRREYPVNVLKSLLIGIAIIASILAIPYLATLLHQNATVKEKPITDPVCTLRIVNPVVEPPSGMDKKITPPKGDPIPNLGPPIIVDIIEDTIVETTIDEPVSQGPENGTGDPMLGAIGGTGGNRGMGGGTPFQPDTVLPPIGLDRNPSFPGGEEALHRFLGDNLVYPEYAKDIGVEGRVFVTFVVNELGNVSNIKVPREIGGGCDEEAMRVVKMMPKWDPGILAGRPVKVSFHLPIVFKLNY